ncbi:MAG: hypothetical protein VZR00_06105 [Lachnospiraceae bacterium]|nr:hypothetical protein [Lachnospiraceae bacterium]MEE3461450.1 hypothetical protein [Lachnospiraceae bacterium]
MKHKNERRTGRRWIMLICCMFVGIIVGRLAGRFLIDLMAGGTLFGGNLL